MKLKINCDKCNSELSYEVKIQVIKEHYQGIAARTHKKIFAGKTKAERSAIMQKVSKARLLTSR